MRWICAKHPVKLYGALCFHSVGFIDMPLLSLLASSVAFLVVVLLPH